MSRSEGSEEHEEELWAMRLAEVSAISLIGIPTWAGIQSMMILEPARRSRDITRCASKAIVQPGEGLQVCGLRVRVIAY